MAIEAMTDALASDEYDGEKEDKRRKRASDLACWTKGYEAYIAAKVSCGIDLQNNLR